MPNSAGHHKVSRQTKPFIIGEEVEPRPGSGLQFGIDTISQIKLVNGAQYVYGTTEWVAAATNVRRIPNSTINKHLRKGK